MLTVMGKKIAFSVMAVLLLCAACALQKNDKTEKIKVSGRVMQVKAYCGGARLPEERYAELRKPKPYSNKKLFVKKGKRNDFNNKEIIEFVSDAEGNFSFSLPPGEYCIIDEYKNDKTNYDKLLEQYKKPIPNYSAISPSCLKEWFETPDAVVIVTESDVTNLVVTFHDKCPWNAVPCVTYHGPLPG